MPLKFLLTIVMLVGATISARGEPMPPETFSNHPETRWRVFTDTVMGGVSTGQGRALIADLCAQAARIAGG